jgi:hypothetical protein
MISRIHSKLGTAGLVVAIVALVVALTGVAFAAVPGLNSKQKKEVKKIAKQFAGKPGPMGPQGPAGLKGDPGPEGKQGGQGIEGKEGPEGPEGEEGPEGPEGEPGTCSKNNTECILPAGATETGAWAVGPSGVPELAAMPFNIPLENAPEAMYFVNKEGEEQTTSFPIEFKEATNCLGSADEPTAPAGVLCVYSSQESFPGEGLTARTPTLNSLSELFTSGATLFFTGEEGFALGTYAVTAK